MSISKPPSNDGWLRELGVLHAAYQPIVRLNDVALIAHEGLIRAEADPVVLPPPAMLELARRADRLSEFELEAMRVVLAGFGFAAGAGKLFVNLSAQCLVHTSGAAEEVVAACAPAGAPSGSVVVELSERDGVADIAPLAAVVARLREAGLRIALDDFGKGHSNFEMWHELKPDYVKIDRYLVDGLRHSTGRMAIIHALVDVAVALGTDLVAEGIEHPDDLRLLRDVGVRYGQGFLLGMPAPTPGFSVAPVHVVPAAEDLVPLRPSGDSYPAARMQRVGQLLMQIEPVSPATTSGEVARIFERQPALHALPVVRDGVPLGLINRRAFMEQFARPFVRELRARESCVHLMSPSPVICEADLPIDAMIDVLRGEDQRYLADGFVIVRNGHYAGVARGDALVRSVTELRIEAARYANPLTLLPGNIPITEHIARLLNAGRPFAAAYFDLNNFKPFNDAYGYFRGDEAIRLLAQVMTSHVANGVDFVGHIGGDDFIVLYQSDDWHRRCVSILRAFNGAMRQMFTPADQARGGFESEDRNGLQAFFPLTTVAVGIAYLESGASTLPMDVANLAAAAKREAKRRPDGLWVQGPAPPSG